MNLSDDRIRPIFRDRDELRAAGSLTDELRGALAGSDFLIVLCSPASAASRWVNEEVRYFKSRRDGDHVLCLIVDGDGTVEHLLAEALRFDVEASGEIDRAAPREPIAADLRQSGDGRRLAYLKLVAGLLGTSLDALVQRDQARRVRVLAGVATLSIVGMILMAGLTTYAFQQRARAVSEAETSRQVADFLVGLFEVSNPATQNPRTITALEILERGAKDIRTSLTDQPEVKGVLMTTIGRVYYNLGLYDESRALLETGTALFEPGSMRALGARRVLANVATRAANYDEAEAAFSDIARELAQAHPLEIEELAQVELGWATLELFRSHHTEAAAHYQRAADGFRQVAGSEPLLARSLEGLANIYTDSGRHEDAERLLLEAIALKEAALGPDHVDTGATYHNLAVLHLDMARYDEAIQNVGRALEIFDRTLEPDHPNVATARMTLGRGLHLAGKLDEGIENLELAAAIGDRAYGHVNLFNAIVRVYLARALSSARQTSKALATIDAARGIYLEVVGDDPTYIGDLLVNRAAIANEAGDVDSAVATCEEALERLDQAGEPALRETFGRECDVIIAGAPSVGDAM
jgi:tetratricopeptide (TPR) repeat protein